MVGGVGGDLRTVVVVVVVVVIVTSFSTLFAGVGAFVLVAAVTDLLSGFCVEASAGTEAGLGAFCFGTVGRSLIISPGSFAYRKLLI